MYSNCNLMCICFCFPVKNIIKTIPYYKKLNLRNLTPQVASFPPCLRSVTHLHECGPFGNVVRTGLKLVPVPDSRASVAAVSI